MTNNYSFQELSPAVVPTASSQIGRGAARSGHSPTGTKIRSIKVFFFNCRRPFCLQTAKSGRVPLDLVASRQI